MTGRPPRRQAAPPVYVSMYEPAGRRRCWWYAYRCPTCGTYQFGRSRELSGVTGVRRAGCGHKIAVLVARVYTGKASA